MGIGVDRLFSIFGDKRRLLAEATQANIEHEAAKQAGENEGAIAFKRKKAEEALEAFNQFRPVKVYRQELAKFGDEMDALARYGNQVNHFTISIPDVDWSSARTTEQAEPTVQEDSTLRTASSRPTRIG